MSITCTVCGTVNPDGTKFCEGCGVELPTQPTTPPVATEATDTSNIPAAPAPASTVTETPALSAPETATPGEVAPDAPVESAPLENPPLETPPLEPVTPASDTVTSGPVDINSNAPTTPTDAVPSPITPGQPDMPVTDTPETSAPVQPADASVAVPVSTPVEPVVATSSASAGEAPAGEAKLGIKKYGTATGEFIPLQGEKLVVGRFDASTGPVDIDLSGLGGQEHISRRHAELYREGGLWKVRDLGSTNGVYVKRKGESSFSPRLQEPAELHDGDELAFGNLMLTFNQS